MTTSSATPRRKSPTGREEVAAAILAAATDLFAERGPAATSIRDIAARSNVNHGLVFRHFGTKDQLVGAVLNNLSMTTTAMRRGGAPAAEQQHAGGRHLQVLARTLLDGYPVGKLQTQFPGMSELLDAIRPRYTEDRSARLAVANAAALQFGWRLFEPFLRASTGLDDLSEDELRAAVVAEVARIVEPH
jgi:TetR/AcrR family transcriptional regulator, repressor for neighboring sulfatase